MQILTRLSALEAPAQEPAEKATRSRNRAETAAKAAPPAKPAKATVKRTCSGCDNSYTANADSEGTVCPFCSAASRYLRGTGKWTEDERRRISGLFRKALKG